MDDNLELCKQAIEIPPSYCEYAGGSCDQSFDGCLNTDGFFIYPNQPELISKTIEESITRINSSVKGKHCISWKNLDISGQIIFCKICKAIRYTRLVVADVTTLNFNLLFEIGYAIGLGKPVRLIRDDSYTRDNVVFDELGLLDNIGYISFHNSSTLSDDVIAHFGDTPIFDKVPEYNSETPLYLVKSPIQSEGMIKLMSVLKKSGLRFRTFDSRETSRLSLHDAHKQVCSSYGIIAHLIDPNRIGAVAHNARCAFFAGMSMAANRCTIMLQESIIRQPVDYRDVIKAYSDPSDINNLLIPIIRSIVERLQEKRFVATAMNLRPLEKIDLGDLAAENEIGALRTYFVPTGQYLEAKRGHARLVVGRKGTGKTAIFYGVRSAYKPSNDFLVLDLKPEGHQFTKLREFILKELSPGLRQHVLTAFWNYVLLMEIAHKIIVEEDRFAYRDHNIKEAFEKISLEYGSGQQLEEADFSERLLQLVDSILERRKDIVKISSTADVTQLIYSKEINPLGKALSEYLRLMKKEAVWILFDNLDKGWPVTCATSEDIMIVKCLLEATRKIERQFETKKVEFHSIVFVRNDIYHHLVADPADRGKETAVILDWNDPEIFKEMIRKRIIYSTQMDLAFDILWSHFFETHINGEDSFSYILDRTLLRPREVLRFTRESINTAVSRGHEKVTQDDVLQAEKSFSDDLLVEITYELRDVSPSYAEVPYAFIGCKTLLSKVDVERLLLDASITADKLENAVDLLLWFGFLGIKNLGEDDERYSYSYQHDIRKFQGITGNFTYCIHPGFRKALGCH